MFNAYLIVLPGVTGGEHKERLSSQASEFAKTFRDELKKGSEEIFKDSQPPRK